MREELSLQYLPVVMLNTELSHSCLHNSQTIIKIYIATLFYPYLSKAIIKPELTVHEHFVSEKRRSRFHFVYDETT